MYGDIIKFGIYRSMGKKVSGSPLQLQCLSVINRLYRHREFPLALQQEINANRTVKEGGPGRQSNNAPMKK